MKLVGLGKLAGFIQRHADVRPQVEGWCAEVEEAEWKTPQDVKRRHSSASFISGNRVVFNLKGNKYRLDTKIAYENETVMVMRIGTHEEYDTWTF